MSFILYDNNFTVVQWINPYSVKIIEEEKQNNDHIGNSKVNKYIFTG